MIVSVSRRTDIPAFYSEWFFNRLKEGFVYVQNPMNPKQVSKVILSPETVDCFVFWTKNAKPMLKHLDELKDYKYYEFKGIVRSKGRFLIESAFFVMLIFTMIIYVCQRYLEFTR